MGQLPWCWLCGSEQDVPWASHLVERVQVQEISDPNPYPSTRDIFKNVVKHFPGLHDIRSFGAHARSVIRGLMTGTSKSVFELPTAGRSNIFETEGVLEGPEWMLPIVFGRP